MMEYGESIEELGSPPHTRGKAAYIKISLEAFRITPAHAGKSHPLWGLRAGQEDHPRTRGEKV